MQADLSTSDSKPSFEPIRESRFHREICDSRVQQTSDTFRLLLSMVTQDALELDAFNLPETKEPEFDSELEKQFFVQGRKLSGEIPIVRNLEKNQLITAGFKASVDLNLCLHPEPLVTEVYDLPSEVFDNLDFNVRQRLLKSNQIKPKSDEVTDQDETAIHATHKAPVDIESWFNVLSEARAYSQLR